MLLCQQSTVDQAIATRLSMFTAACDYVTVFWGLIQKVRVTGIFYGPVMSTDLDLGRDLGRWSQVKYLPVCAFSTSQQNNLLPPK